MTSSTSVDVNPVRATRPATTVAASFVTGVFRNIPPNRPTGVRTGSQMTASRTGALLGSSCSDARLATVGRDGLAGQEIASVQSQVGDDAGKLRGIAHPAGRDAPQDLREQLR